MHSSAQVRTYDRALILMEPLSAQIAEFSSRLFGTGEDLEYGTFSPYVPLSLYQAAVVQHRLWKRTGDASHEGTLHSLKKILGFFHRRWAVAGMLSPALMLSLS